MVILFSNRKNKLEKELIEILTAFGADFISDKSVTALGGFFTVCSIYKNADIKCKKGIALILDDTDKYSDIKLDSNIIGICDAENTEALKIFSKNPTPVITCGNNQKNTLTLSSFTENSVIISLQRNVKTIFGNQIYQGDYKVNLSKKYSNSALMFGFAILILHGKIPEKF